MHSPTCNITCVCCVTVYFVLVLILQRWRNILKQDKKVLKARKLSIFTFVWYEIICNSTQPFWSLWGV